MCYAQWTIPDQYIRKQDGVHLFNIQMTFEYQTIWHPTSVYHLNTKLVWNSDPYGI